MDLPRIAILLIIHQKNYQTLRLINHLAQDFDLYIHIDKKATFSISEEEFDVKHKIHIYNRYEIHHGRFNMILAELLLMEEAAEKGYDRYIVISGSDIPLKKNSEIIDFFKDNVNEYFSYAPLPFRNWGDSGGLDRLRYYYSNVYRKNDGNRLQFYFSQVISFINKEIIIKLFKFFKIGRKIDYNFYGGSSWLNLTHDCVSKILKYLSKDLNYVNRYRYTRSGDEIFFQTIICNDIGNLHLVNDDLRLIDWSHSQERPYVFRYRDIARLIQPSRFLFARKFDPFVDQKIIETLYDRLQ